MGKLQAEGPKSEKEEEMTTDHVHGDEPAHHEVHESSGLAGYAVIKYGFILVITIVVLYFVARYLLPLLGD
jgi:hypothetical protein